MTDYLKAPQTLSDRQLLEALYNMNIAILRRLDILEHELLAKSGDMEYRTKYYFADTMTNVKNDFDELKQEFTLFDLDK